MKKAAFSKTVRIKKESDFRRVIGEGVRKRGGHFTLFRLRVPENKGQRFGIKIARGVTGSVVRNRLKRAVREVLRKNRCMFASDESVVIVCNADAQEIGLSRLRQELEDLMR
jgi:ribonuclease P protein component